MVDEKVEKKIEAEKVDETVKSEDKKIETGTTQPSRYPQGADVSPGRGKDKKKKKKSTVVKDLAIANGYSLKISPKYSVQVCKVIRGKSPDAAIERLEAVVKKKRAIPMAGLEVAHQKGRGLAGAKYPKNVCEEIIKVIKQVKANAEVNGIDEPIIVIAKANQASAPLRRGGRKAKRTHIYLEVKDKSKLMEAKQ